MSLFKKSKQPDNKQKAGALPAEKDCANDPDCPMCHISDDVVKQLKDSVDDSEKNDSRAKEGDY